MPPRPEDNYNSAPSVNPTTNAPNDYLNIRATPDAFGAQVGQSLQKLGATVQQGDNQASDYLIQKQGMINETAASNGDSQYQVTSGKILSDYKQNLGFAAANAAPDAIKAVQDQREQIRSSLGNSMAKRAFDQLTLRSQGFAIRDINDHVDTQLKQAHTDSATNGRELAINNGSDPTIANDPVRSADNLAAIKFYTQQLAQAHGLITPGPDGKITTDSNHDPVFDTTTPEGQSGKAYYDNEMDKATGQFWENRIRILGSDPEKGDWMKANQVFQDNRSQIPPETQAKISAMLYGPIHNAQTRSVADGVINQADADYTASISGSFNGKFNTDQLSHAIIGQESGGNPNVKDSVSGAVGIGQIMPSTFAEFAKPGEDIRNSADNLAVHNRMIAKYSQDYKGDPERISVAYYSGPGNVSPPGFPTPWLVDKVGPSENGKPGVSTAAYVAGVVKRLGSAGGNVQYQTKADYYEQHLGDIINKAGNDYAALHPDDTVGIDQAKAYAESYVRTQITTARMSQRADYDLVQRAVNGEFSNGQLLTSPQQLLSSPNKDVRDAYQRFSVENPIGWQNFNKNVITANAHGQANNYGTDFWKYYERVNLPEGDPNKIKDPSTLYSAVGGGPDAPITNTGLGILTGQLGKMSTPGGVAFQQAEHNFFSQMRGHITGTDKVPGITDKNGDTLFEKFMMDTLPRIQAGQSQGKTPGQLFDPKSADYVGKNLTSFQRPLDKTLKDMSDAVMSKTVDAGTIFSGANPTNNNLLGNIHYGLRTKSMSTDDAKKALNQAYLSKQITKEQALKFGTDNGFYIPTSIPLPK